MTELVARSVIYLLFALVVLAAAFWWGWEMRERLALKLEHFRITNRQWRAYDVALKRGESPARVHDINAHREGA